MQTQSGNKGEGAAWLVDAWGRGLALGRFTTIVGRSRGADGVQIMHASVSKMHARITRQGNGAWFVEDLSSTNGTWIGDIRIIGDSKKVLKHGEILMFGQIRMAFCSAPRATELELLESARQEAKGVTPVLTEVLAVPQSIPKTLVPTAVPTPEPVPVESAALMCGLKSVNLRGEQLSIARALIAQARFDVEIDAAEGAFVHAKELAKLISRRAELSSKDQLDQLIVALRSLFHTSGLGLTIEAKPGLGYRVKPMMIAAKAIILSRPSSKTAVPKRRGPIVKEPSWAKPK